MNTRVLRILDANFNRSREGLRVCEEVARFVLDDAVLTKQLKRLRHAVTGCIKKIPVTAAELASARNVRADVGKKPSGLERRRSDATALFLANAERAKESLRVLEEASKLVNRRLPDRFKKIRFSVYAIEKRALPKLEAVRDH